MKKRDDFYLEEILDRISLIESYIRRLSEKGFLKSDIHRSAVVRELEVIGEAVKAISDETKRRFPEIPWSQMSAMRNRLIHGYFDVDYKIVWDVARVQLKKLKPQLLDANAAVSPKVHPWRLCPLGQYYTESVFDRKVRPSKKHPTGKTKVHMPCRKNPSGKDQLYPKEILIISSTHSVPGTIGHLESMTKSNSLNDYDELILLWVKYWNDVLTSADSLTADIVKALIYSESDFKLKLKPVRVSKGNFARGIAQVTDRTRKYLKEGGGELKDHFLTLTASDVLEPSVAICASVRWLFRKRETASSFLQRPATWEETVAEYKAYLRTDPKWRATKGMKKFMDALTEIRGSIK